MLTKLEMDIFAEFKLISVLLKRNSDRASGRKTTGITGGQSHVMGFLLNCEKAGIPVYQKDIEAEFGIRGSTVSRLLQSMEKNGLIKRSSNLQDGRLKCITLTDKARETVSGINHSLGLMAEEMLEGVTTEEREMLLRIYRKIRINSQRMGGQTEE